MAIDFLGLGYAGALIMGGLIGYKKKGRVKQKVEHVELLGQQKCRPKSIFLQVAQMLLKQTEHLPCFAGSVTSLVAGLLFGIVSLYGAYKVSYERSDVTVSLREYLYAIYLYS